ncbi:hypothetical protein [Qipengyuania sp. SM2507]
MKRNASLGDLVAMSGVGAATCGASIGLGFGLWLLAGAGFVETGVTVIFTPLMGAAIGLLIGWIPAFVVGAPIVKIFGAGPWQCALAGYVASSAFLIVGTWPNWPTFDAPTVITTILFLFGGISGGLLAWRFVIRGPNFAKPY